MTRPASQRPPAQVAPYVTVLGAEGTIEFLLAFGGAELYLTQTPKRRGRLVALVGHDQAVALAKASEHLPRRIPLAKPWIAAVMRERGLSVADIARKLHASDVAVRRWLKQYDAAAPANPNQLELPLFQPRTPLRG